MNSSPTVLKAQALSKSYPEQAGPLQVLDEISFELCEASTMAIMGRSGSGKTTLLQLLGGLEQPTEGAVYWGNTLLSSLREKAAAQLRNRHLGFVYQQHRLLAEFTALENAAMPLLVRGEPSSSAFEQAAFWLNQVGLQHRLQHEPATLSGGEKQRVALARALVTEPACILADEPTGNLDEANARLVLNLIQLLRHQSKTAWLVVTHDPLLASSLDSQYRLQGGRLVEVAYDKTPPAPLQ